MTAPGPLTPERILVAAEDVLRRFGPGKTTVVDVARTLGVSHGTVYRHFPSKTALRDAVAERWLRRVSDPLERVAGGSEPPPRRLRRWLEELIAAKRGRLQEDPQLFATYVRLVAEAREVVQAHVATLVAQLERIVAAGVLAGDFSVSDTRAAARAVLDATGRFHNPVHSAEWSGPGLDAAFEGVLSLVLSGLRGRTAVTRSRRPRTPRAASGSGSRRGTASRGTPRAPRRGGGG